MGWVAAENKGIRWDGLVAVWEIAAGPAGLGLVLAGLPRGVPPRPAGLVEPGISCIVFILLVLGGVLLWREERAGYILSGFLQLLQAVSFQRAGFLYSFAAGPKAGLALHWPGPSVLPLLDLGCRLRLSFSAPAEVGLELNFLALLTLALLAAAYSRRSRRAGMMRDGRLGSADVNAMYTSRFRQWP